MLFCSIEELEERVGALTVERDALAAAAADLEQDRACAAHGEAVAQAEVRHLRALAEFLEARAAPTCISFGGGLLMRDVDRVRALLLQGFGVQKPCRSCFCVTTKCTRFAKQCVSCVRR